jgi:hypothetical protein
MSSERYALYFLAFLSIFERKVTHSPLSKQDVHLSSRVPKSINIDIHSFLSPDESAAKEPDCDISTAEEKYEYPGCRRP